MMKGILAIGGSDPSGGAGIQADLKTFACLRVAGCAAVTCLTAQDSSGVHCVSPVNPSFVIQQVELVLRDLPITHLKTGMIGTGDIASALGGILKNFQGQIVCDPVMRASDGTPLFETGARAILEENILANATVLTPNVVEFMAIAKISRMGGKTADKVQQLFDRFPRLEAIVIKGGHAETDSGVITDSLYLRAAAGLPEIIDARHPRHDTGYTHGTGCTFASAYGAGLLKTGNHEKAFHIAVNFVDSILETSARFMVRAGRGPVLHHLAKPATDDLS